MKKIILLSCALMLMFSFSNSFGMDHQEAKKQLRAIKRDAQNGGRIDTKKAMQLEQDAKANGLNQIAAQARSLHKRTQRR